jgi:hypothetical protein
MPLISTIFLPEESRVLDPNPAENSKAELMSFAGVLQVVRVSQDILTLDGKLNL